MTAAGFDKGRALPAPAGHAPVRQPHSIRRTSTLDITWRGDRDGERTLHGTARDIYTESTSMPPVIIALDSVSAEISGDHRITSIHADPARADLCSLVGIRASSGALRAALGELVCQNDFQHSPLYLMLDDMVGANIVADWAWSRWLIHTPALRARRKSLLDSMAGVCTGFAPGSSSLRSDGGYQENHAARVPDLVHPQDPDGWHTLSRVDTVAFRRARRMDIRIDGDIIVDAGFQDSATDPDGSRIAVHEYSLRATIDPQTHTHTHTHTLKTLIACPHVLPFPECPGAVNNLNRLIGVQAEALRMIVRQQLSGATGCTHLNDVVRALADVPGLVKLLSGFASRQGGSR